MYWWVPVSIAAVVIAAMFGYAYGRSTDNLEPLSELASPTAAPSSVPNPTGEPRQADFYLYHCLPDEAGALDEVQIAAVFECLKLRGIEGTAVSATGSVPATVFKFAGGDYLTTFYITWRASDGRRVQQLNDANAYIGEDLAASGEAMRQANIGNRTMMVLMVDGPRGSTSPHTRPILLAYEQDRWRVRWVGGGGDMSLLDARRTIKFDGPAIDRLIVAGDAFILGDEENAATEVFYESNAGPHRYYTQTWELRGEEYLLTSSTVRPSPYNTTIEFIKALRAGDVIAAAAYAVDPTLVAEAIALGIGDPAPNWNGDTIPDEWSGADVAARLIELRPDCTEPGANLRLTFTEGADGPVISGIYVADPAPAC